MVIFSSGGNEAEVERALALGRPGVCEKTDRISSLRGRGVLASSTAGSAVNATPAHSRSLLLPPVTAQHLPESNGAE